MQILPRILRVCLRCATWGGGAEGAERAGGGERAPPILAAPAAQRPRAAGGARGRPPPRAQSARAERRARDRRRARARRAAHHLARLKAKGRRWCAAAPVSSARVQNKSFELTSSHDQVPGFGSDGPLSVRYRARGACFAFRVPLPRAAEARNVARCRRGAFAARPRARRPWRARARAAARGARGGVTRGARGADT